MFFYFTTSFVIIKPFIPSISRQMLSVEQRYNICLMAERHPKWTQLELAQWAYEAFQLSNIPSQGTISRLLAKKLTYMNAKEHEKDANRLRKPNNVLVRRILQEWISQSIWNGIPITSPIIQDTAQAVWHRIPADQREGNGSFSYKWISNFLSRMDFSISDLDEELPKTPKIWTFEERDQLKQLFSNVRPKDLFTLDETFLAYNLPLDYAQYEMSHIQRRIEVATVMLCSNLDGSEKLKPLVVGKYNSYRSFRNYFPDDPSNPVQLSQLGEKMANKFEISYHSNRKSWLTSNLFHNWLARWDKRLVADNRKIFIVLDDSCSHRIINLHLKNITLIYTSSNSRFLPFNWGVLDEFKTRYRIQQYQALIELQRKIENKLGRKYHISFEQSQLTMSNAFKFIKRAWDSIPANTIKANWKSSGLVPPEMLPLTQHISMAFRKNEILEAHLNALCREYHCQKQWEYDMLLDLNIENKNTNFLSTEELVESAIIDELEPENEYYADSALPSTTTSQIGIDELINRIPGNVAADYRDGVINELTSIPSLHGDHQLQQSPMDTTTTDNLNTTHFTRESSQLNLLATSHVSTVTQSDTARYLLGRDNSTMDRNIVTNPIDSSLNNNINGYFAELNQGTNHNTNDNNSNSLFNVSTLIDKPSLFFNGNIDLDLQDLGVDVAGADYFNDLFSNTLSGTSNDGINTQSNIPLPGSTDAANEVTLPYTLVNNISPPASVPHLHSNSDIVIGETQIKNNHQNIESNSNDTILSQGNTNFELNSLNNLISNRSNANIPSTFPSFNHASKHFQNHNSPSDMLQTNIDIAKSLGNIIKHSENNEISLSRGTMNEIRSNYMTLLKMIKRTRQQLYKSKLRTRQNHLDNVLSTAAEVPDLLPTNGNDKLLLDDNLRNTTSFF